MAAWRWADRAETYAQVVLLYTPAGSDPAWGEALVDFVFSELARAPTLRVIEARMRDETPGAREAWLRHDVAFFERCRMALSLGQLPLPVLPTPRAYRIARWEEEHQPQAEQVAIAARDGTVDAVAIPDAQGPRLAENLRRLRAGTGDRWLDEASFVALDRKTGVVAYIAATQAGNGALIADLATHPAHRRQGLARLLLIRSLGACLRLGIASATLAVTTRNPARQLVNQLGFRATDCGEVAIWWRDGRHLVWRE
jgi:GNAT superfamily N-acetyltransferase